MISGLVRLTAAAAAILVGTLVLMRFYPWASRDTFGRVLEGVATAQTLHLKVARAHLDDIWIKRPGQLRWNESDGTYRIVTAGKLWSVDEKANRAVSQPSPYLIGSDKSGLDLLTLAHLTVRPNTPASQALLGARPAGKKKHEGVECLFYRMEISGITGQKVYIEALVDAATKQLRTLEARAEAEKGTTWLGYLEVVAYNPPVSDKEFVVKDTLTEDGRIGKVLDTQGVVAVKPVNHQRWTPVCEQMLLKPGDWVRTDVRGANAVEIGLVKRTTLILGPGTLVELIRPDRVRLLAGEVEIAAPVGVTVELLGADGQKAKVQGTQLYRRDGDKLALLDKAPLWLTGFKGAVAHESIGSLVAQVDGRNVPLSVGYHKVAVEIRDQIARTTIEESFVNHTEGLLEGVFYFPLPQDASISGFGMWIGNNLVEADVVEKQRAREIYETILQEKRDPGLLEWSGGNLFKARVYPIFAHSEKRIKITYTQVLPLRGSRYRYSYGLQSDMLQQHPLRELAIDVKVNSAVPLKSVSSPTHETRSAQTAHSAHVEFSAQEYTPTRDFEVVVEVDGKQSEVVVVPHRRGDDGYFLLELTAPAADDADDERDMLSDGSPLELLILADTSATMDAGQRKTQDAFLAALFASLTSKDTVNLAACDVSCDWVFEKAMPAEAANLTAARRFLAKRASLGWTDLDKAFAAAFQRCGPATQIIYIGDGIVTARGDADPVAFTQRLRRLAQGKPGVAHAVAVGSIFEPGVLKAIGAIGGGSFRRVSGDRGPQAVARDLLRELTQPPLRDLKVEFKGVRTARVYPEQLPNLPAGSQQILLGRYLPEGQDQVGEVVVTGVRGSKPVEFRHRFALKDAEQGNSFIPRLWARMHLDHLLERGTSDAVKDEVIALSQEYQIITPYTSFLVLETDADRERFGVKRRFVMRDGERFFAQGRDNANYELKQQQMKRAGDWRLGLRRTVLRQLATLGRDVRLLQAARNGWVGSIGTYNGRSSLSSLPTSSTAHEYGAVDFERNAGEVDLGLEQLENGHLGAVDRKKAMKSAELGDELDLAEPAEPAPASPEPDLDVRDLTEAADKSPVYQRDELAQVLDDLGYEKAKSRLPGLRSAKEGEYFSGLAFRSPARAGRPVQWLNPIFPSLPPAPRPAKEPRSTWPAAAHALAQSLLRTEQLAKLTGGLEIVRQTELVDARWDEPTAHYQWLYLYSPAAWLTRTSGDNNQALVNWCDGRERGVFSRPFRLGRLRAATPRDVRNSPLSLEDFSLSSIEHAYVDYPVAVEQAGADRAVLVIQSPYEARSATRVLVDTARHVILSIEHRQRGQVSSTTRFEDFVEVAGCWWARRIEVTDAQGRQLSRTTQTVKALPQQKLEQRWRQELAGRDQVLFIRQPLPTVAAARRAVADGKAALADQLVLLVYFAGRQQSDRAREHLEAVERLATGKPGLHRLRNAFLNVSRRHEELAQRMLAEAERLAASTTGGEEAEQDRLYLADYLSSQARGILSANEMLKLLQQLEPVYRRKSASRQALTRWQQMRAEYLQQVGPAEEALRAWKELAVAFPHDAGVQHQYAQTLANQGAHAEAYAWLERVLGEGSRWSPNDEQSLRGLYARLLEEQGRFADQAAYLAEWLKRSPEAHDAYQRYLSALIRSDQADKANALALQWLKEGQAPGELTPVAAAHLEAAVSLMLGRVHNFYSNQIDERWLAPLGQAVLALSRDPERIRFADAIMSAPQIQNGDEGRHARKVFADRLSEQVNKLHPVLIRHYVGWVMADNPPVAPAVWKGIADGLRRRWAAETSPHTKHQLGQALVQVLSGRFSPAELIAFQHTQLREGPEADRPEYAQQLFNTLLGQPWSAEYEDEALALLAKLSADVEEPGDRLGLQVVALYRLTDRMIAARFAVRMKAIEHPEKLSRTELQAKKAEQMRLARAEFAARLQREAKKKDADPLGPRLTIERLYLETLLNQDLPKVAAACWDYLGKEPPAPAPLGDDDPEQLLKRILEDRYLTTLANLAARANAEPVLVERLLKYIEQGVAADGADLRWKLLKYRLLIALDRPKELEQVLRQWTQADDPDSRWQLSLGYLLAEQGRIREAIQLFEALEKASELGPAAYRTLADWYMVVNQRDRYNQAQVAAYKTLEEWQLSRLIQIRLQPWQRPDRPLPTELDKEVLILFQALFEKASQPQGYLGQLQQFYQVSHDFRLLAGLADAVVGHSAGRVYPFLEGMQPILTEIRDEATSDELVRHLAEVRRRAQTPVDRRALDLLEMLVERRAAELQNQPGPHVARALAALQRAFQEKWTEGEPRLMADLLAGLGRIVAPPLAQEQLRQLQALQREGAEGSYDRLHLAHRLAQALGHYERTREAIDLLQTALNDFETGRGGVLPISANGPLNTLVSFLEGAGRHQAGEQILTAQLRHPVHQQQQYWLTQRRYQLHAHALQAGGTTSLGSGRELYQALQSRFRDDLATPDPSHRDALIHRLCAVYRTAQNKKLPGVIDDLKAFAFTRLPQVLKAQANNYPTVMREVAQTVHDLAGPREGVAFIVSRIESEPGWYRYNNQDSWSQLAWYIGRWRIEDKEAAFLGDELDARLLKVVVAELKRDLEGRQRRGRTMYDRRYGDYWAEKEEAFVQAAEEVLARRRQSGAAVCYIAEYLAYGLERTPRAIEILYAADKQKLLDEAGQLQLVEYLHRAGRHAESIALLEPWVKRRPENLSYRVLLLSAYFHSGRPNDLLAQLADTDKFFHQQDRWTESVMATLAHSCLQNRLFEQSVAYYQELIPLYQRTHPRRGIGDGNLSGYYTHLAQAYSALGKTAEAVEAASGAVVSWTRSHGQRAGALGTLQQVLREARDLDAYVAHLDAQAAETGRDSAVIRKAVGQAYFTASKYAQAAVQLQLACDLQPNDAETYQLLIDCYDRQGDRAGAVAQVLRSLELSRRELKRYQDLGHRLEGLDQPREAERAYTSIVAVLPQEAESHALLAEVRQGQNRWAEAIPLWEHVARLRALEPTGLLKLAAAQVHERQWEQAAETLRRVAARNWPPRFSDVAQQVRDLERQIEAGRRKR